jgi:hypothetical protein
VWWEHSAFAERIRIEAAELVAFEVLEPTLRSRGAIRTEARRIYNDVSFHAEMLRLFANEPTDRWSIPTLQDALERISELERRLAALEAKLAE